MRKVQMRRARREEVVAMRAEHRTDEGEQSEVLAMLDEGLGELGAEDREALVRRYLQEQPLAAVGQALGVSEDAARKRVDRGLAKLRKWFGRRGIQTSSAVLAAVLVEEAKSAVLPAGMRAVLTQGIVQACQAGAGGAGVGFGVAQGIKTMMLMTQLKLFTLALATVLASGGVSWVAMMQVGGKAAAQNPTTRPASLDEVVLDRSTPEKAVESMIQAMKASDRPKTFLCLGVDPNRPRTPVDSIVELTLVENRMIRAAAKAFGGNGEEVRNALTVDVMAKVVLSTTLVVGKQATIDGDLATLVIDLPELALRWLPEEIGVLQGKTIRFRKQEGQWTVDLDHTIHLNLTLLGQTVRDNSAITDPDAQVALIMEVVRAIEQMTEDIEHGRLKTIQATKNATDQRFMEILNKQGPYVAVSIMPSVVN
jgi:hypothetical protein